MVNHLYITSFILVHSLSWIFSICFFFIDVFHLQLLWRTLSLFFFLFFKWLNKWFPFHYIGSVQPWWKSHFSHLHNNLSKCKKKKKKRFSRGLAWSEFHSILCASQCVPHSPMHVQTQTHSHTYGMDQLTNGSSVLLKDTWTCGKEEPVLWLSDNPLYFNHTQKKKKAKSKRKISLLHLRQLIRRLFKWIQCLDRYLLHWSQQDGTVFCFLWLPVIV